MRNMRTGMFAVVAVALMLSSALVTSIPVAAEEEVDIPPIDFYRNNQPLEGQPVLGPDSTFDLSTDTNWDQEQDRLVTVVKAGKSGIDMHGAQLWINGIGDAAGQHVTVTMQMAFDPIGDQENTTGDWLLHAGLRVTLLKESEPIAYVVLSQGENAHESGVETFQIVDGDVESLVIGDQFDVAMVLENDIEYTEGVGSLSNMRFTLSLNGAAYAVYFKNNQEVLKVEIISDDIKGPVDKPVAEPGSKKNVFVGWNEDGDVKPSEAVWVEKLQLDPQSEEDIVLCAIFAERGDMDSDGAELTNEDVKYLIKYIAFHDLFPDKYKIRQDPSVTENVKANNEDVKQLIKYIAFRDIFPGKYDLSPSSHEEEWKS